MFMYSYLDDILVMGTTSKEHLEIQEVNQIGNGRNEAQRAKVCRLLPEVEYFGHQITLKVKYRHTRVKAITEAPALTNISELKAFLELANYYDKSLHPCTSFCGKIPVRYRGQNRICI